MVPSQKGPPRLSGAALGAQEHFRINPDLLDVANRKNGGRQPVLDVAPASGEGHGDVVPRLAGLAVARRLAAQLSPALLEHGLPLLLGAHAQTAQVPVTPHTENNKATARQRDTAVPSA